MRTASAFTIVAALMFVGAVSLGRPAIPVAAAQSAASGDAKANNDALEEQIIAKEREGLDALKTGDLSHFGRITADEAIFVDAQGAATKAQVLTNVAAFTLSDYSMENMQFLRLSKQSGLISYKIHEKGVSHAKNFVAQAYVSSIWEKRGHEWVCLFSQETGAR